MWGIDLGEQVGSSGPQRGAQAPAAAAAGASWEECGAEAEEALAAVRRAYGGGVLARVVSRGSAASKASDFGALEVLGGASIGHTNPWTVYAAMCTEFEESLAMTRS